MKHARQLIALAAIAVFSLCHSAMAQGAAGFPSKPVQIIVPTPAGGPSDTAARQLAQALSAAWGQQVVVENKPGAQGAVAAQAAMGARADGYVLLWGQAAMVGLPFVQKNTPYRSMAEFSPVANVLQFGFAMFANKDMPFKTFADFVAYGKAHPDKLNFATGSLAEYMAAVQVLEAVGVQAKRIPYKGGAQLMPDLISGDVQINFGPIQSGLAHAKAGKLNTLVALLPKRSPLLPEVPSLSELGVSVGAIPTWNGLFAPPGTPQEVTEKIAVAVSQALQTPTLRAALEQQGAQALGGSPAQLTQAVEAAAGAWKTFVTTYAIAQE